MTRARLLPPAVILLLIVAAGCAKALPTAVELAAEPAPTGPAVIEARRPPSASPPGPVVAADAARCKGSERRETCLNECWNNRDQAACESLFQSCEEGDATACGHAGHYLEQHRAAAPGERQRIVRYLDAGCTGAMYFACMRLASMLETGALGLPVRPDLAKEYLALLLTTAKAQCERGDTDGCMTAGGAATTGGGSDADPAAARVAYARGYALMNAACVAGDGRECHMLGVYLIEGIGTAVDKKRGRAALERACTLKWKQWEASCLTVKQLFGATVAAP
jgi:TPR repeat protein